MEGRKVIFPLLLAFLIGCGHSEENFTHNFYEQSLRITPLFPGQVTRSLAIDTIFSFKYEAENVNFVSVTFKSELEKSILKIKLNKRTGILRFRSPIKGKNLEISIRPSPVIILFPDESTGSNIFTFKYTMGNAHTYDHLKIEEILPCNRCPFIPEHYTIIFNKPLLQQSAEKLFKKRKVKIDNNIITFYGSEVTIPAELTDIYGKSMTSEVKITYHLPCLFIRELCIDPVHDWNDSKGGNRIPFDSTYGYGTVNSYDQFILLENRCEDKKISFYLSLCNNDCTSTGITPSSKYTRISEDQNLIVIGDPPGNLKDYSEIRIRTPDGETLDFVRYENFSIKGGWWRNSSNYHLSTTQCTIPF